MSKTSQATGSEILAAHHEANRPTDGRSAIKDVLIVEDNRIDGDRMRATVHLVLGRDISVRRAETLTRAVDAVLSSLPDVVLLDDYLKPSDTARDTIPYLRRAGYVGPIVVISGEVDRHRRAELIAAGATLAIHKDDMDSAALAAAFAKIAADKV